MISAVFLGTPAEAVPILAGLADVASVGAVLTRPDAARGRTQRLLPPPVKEAARAWGMRVVQPADAQELKETVARLAPDVAVVAAYGRILGAETLALPRRGFINVHYSLLPRWRGASPVVRALLAGDDVTGVSLMQMDAGLDTGPVLATREVAVRHDDSAGLLTARLAAAGARLLTDELPRIVAGDVVPQPQDEAAATAAGKVSTDEAHLNPMLHSRQAVLRAIRAFNPKPGAWALFDGERIKVWAATESDVEAPPGQIEARDGRAILGVSDGAIALLEVQPAGKGPMSAADWMRGRRGRPARYQVS